MAASLLAARPNRPLGQDHLVEKGRTLPNLLLPPSPPFPFQIFFFLFKLFCGDLGFTQLVRQRFLLFFFLFFLFLLLFILFLGFSRWCGRTDLRH